MSEQEAVQELRKIMWSTTETIDNNKGQKKLVAEGENRIEIFKMAEKALEKQIPKKVTEIHVDEYFCLVCGAENGCDNKVLENKYCPSCGQSLYQENQN